jgi:uncharacterized protein
LLCHFASDLHGSDHRYRKLFEAARSDRPDMILLGGDLLPSGMLALLGQGPADFVADFIGVELDRLRQELGSAYPRVLVIPGNDDGKVEDASFEAAEAKGLLEYIPMRSVTVGTLQVIGYPFVPPTPFRLKDWERYDVSRFVDPGCVAPEDGLHTTAAPATPAPTIQEDLQALAGQGDLRNTVFLFHSPPYQTFLDRAALDGKMIDYCPLDVHVGSIAIRRFIETRQPKLTLHGHVHESARITGGWSDRIGSTVCLSAAHDGPELALVRFDPDAPEAARRDLL